MQLNPLDASDARALPPEVLTPWSWVRPGLGIS